MTSARRGLVTGVVAGALAVSGSAAALVAVPAVASTRAVDPAATFTFTGSGYGHGVGMSQYGARGLAGAGLSGPQIAAHYYSGATATSYADAVPIKVNIVHAASTVSLRTVALATGGGIGQVIVGHVGTETAAPTDTFAVTPGTAAGSLVVVRTGAAGVKTTWTTPSGLTVRWAGTAYLAGAATLIDVAGPGEHLGDASGRYRYGALEVRNVGGRIEVSDVLSLHDEYLRGVAEMPSSWAPAALQAQAIVSRSYALTAYRSGVRTACDCHVYDTTADQVYVGWSKETEPVYGARWVAAVTATDTDATHALVLTAAGAPVKGYFFAATGGRSRDVSSVWGSSATWLKSVDDTWSLDPTVDPAYSAWSATVTDARVAAAFGLPDVAAVVLGNHAGGAALVSATATSSTGAKATITGDQLRSRLGLRSVWVAGVTSTLASQPKPVVDVYSAEGHVQLNGRDWLTRCEAWSGGANPRCWTWTIGTAAVVSGGTIVSSTGWQRIVLTYTEADSAFWRSSPLGHPGTWTASGVSWKTTCTPAAAKGARLCRSYRLIEVAVASGGGYVWDSEWVLYSQARLHA